MNYISELLPQMRLIKHESTSEEQKQFFASYQELDFIDDNGQMAINQHVVWDFTKRLQGE